MTGSARVFPDTYVDSVVALRGMRAMRATPGVQWATAVAATPANLDTLAAEGIATDRLDGAEAGDFCLAVRADDEDAADRALDAGQEAVFAAPAEDTERAAPDARTIRAALEAGPDTNVAVVSVPGEYATLVADQALSAGLHVLLFSDNVPLADEVALKTFARSRDLLVMGPGAGTAMLGGTGLGFANVVTPGPVGVVAAAGTGAQEVMSLLDRWGVGVSHVIGVGGRDLSRAVDGRMTLAGIEALRRDPGTEVILLVSKPPAPDVAQRVLSAAGDTPVVACLVGLDEGVLEVPATATLTRTLEAGVVETLRVLGRTAPDVTHTEGPTVAQARGRLATERRVVRGLFSGGTLCYESLVILGGLLGPVHSNTPLDPAWGLPAPPGSHQCLDLGEEEFTRGRPHPMIDPEARVDAVREHAADPTVAAIVLDVVLGHGSHPDPAGALAPVCREIMDAGGPQVVAYVLGTDHDPQNWRTQRDTLVDAGCIVTETAARASLTAAALATGNLSLNSGAHHDQGPTGIPPRRAG